METGLLGEKHVEQELLKRGWQPSRPGTAQWPSNADIIATRHNKRRLIRIKATDAAKRHSHSHSLGFGYATAYLNEGKPFFNADESSADADVVIAVSHLRNHCRFVVLPVACAEALCRFHSDYWYSIPKRGGERRSPSFPVYLRFTGEPNVHLELHGKVMRTLLAYEDAWHVLDEPRENLHDAERWPLLE